MKKSVFRYLGHTWPCSALRIMKPQTVSHIRESHHLTQQTIDLPKDTQCSPTDESSTWDNQISPSYLKHKLQTSVLLVNFACAQHQKRGESRDTETCTVQLFASLSIDSNSFTVPSPLFAFPFIAPILPVNELSKKLHHYRLKCTGLVGMGFSPYSAVLRASRYNTTYITLIFCLLLNSAGTKSRLSPTPLKLVGEEGQEVEGKHKWDRWPKLSKMIFHTVWHHTQQ